MSERRPRIAVLHGAISNAGDFLIYRRGMRLLENSLGRKLILVDVERFRPFDGDFDGLFILGGPLVTRRLHPHAQNIARYISARNVPVFCIGIGVSGAPFKSNDTYFLTQESLAFWKSIYRSTGLISVRDKVTQDVFNAYGIKAEMTGCCSLFSLDEPPRSTGSDSNRLDRQSVAVTIPQLHLGLPLGWIKGFVRLLYFLAILRLKIQKCRRRLFFQHGYGTLTMKAIAVFARMLGYETHDLSGKSLDASAELNDCGLHIGTRLHCHIFFLTLAKPSFLLDIDGRTRAFLKTIPTPTQPYTVRGIWNLVGLLADSLQRNDFSAFHHVSQQISALRLTMEDFLHRIAVFWEEAANLAQDTNRE